jgi:alpha-amylase
MNTICLYFQVHQPFRLRRYRFFDMGINHYYYDDYSNESLLNVIAERSYLPANKLMLDLIKEYGSQFKITFSISGTAINQFKLYCPEVLESFKKLAKTGCVEFLAETFSHSLVSLKSKEEFETQVKTQAELIEQTFGVKPSVFRNTELIYSDEIGSWVADMGYKAMLTEGARHVLGWKSPNYLYCNAINPRLKLLIRNYHLSDDISFRFSNPSWSEYPLTAEKYVNWIKSTDSKEELVNIFMDYETFGEHQRKETGIFEFINHFVRQSITSGFHFSTPTELADKLQPIAALNVPYPISWADEERDITAWLGNELQKDAFNKLYDLVHLVKQIDDKKLRADWKFLQNSDHFYYMCTKFFSDGEVHKYFNPYASPYDAYINYMNVLSDFKLRLEREVKGKTQSLISSKKTETKVVKAKKTSESLKKETEKKAPAPKKATQDKTKKVASKK